jgi:hypothetical protein
MITQYSNIISVTTLSNLLLDTYTGAAAAYSLRLLRADYTGNAIEVRIDTTGQPTYDIGFVDGELDVTTLEGYCTGGLDAYVTTWYDQSGNGNDATQTTASEQPQIVSGGSVITDNGKPAISFNSDYLTMALISSSTEVTLISISKHTPGGSTQYKTILGVGLNNGYALTTNNNKYNFFYRDVADLRTADNALSTQALIFAYTKNATNQQLFANNVSFQNITPPTMLTPSTSSRIGAFDYSSGIYQGTQQELIVYANSQLTNRSGIQTNINDFYSIY